MKSNDYTDVTEMAGEEISLEQLHRLANRYYWARSFVEGKDVIEVACGTGPGLGYLASHAKSLRAGDISGAMISQVENHYGNRIDCQQFDVQKMPYEDNSADVILIFEALYYVPSAETFVAECKRVLRPGGVVLVSNANCDLYDFNPSPYSHVYHGVRELEDLFSLAGFSSDFWGGSPVAKAGLKQRVLRPVKKIVVSLGLMPKSMAGKRLLKRIVFGASVLMPAEIMSDSSDELQPARISAAEPNRDFKVIYCAAQLP